MNSHVPDSLAGIVLTSEGKAPMKEIDLVTDQERADILLDPIRVNILKILKDGVTDYITTESIDPETGDRIIRQKEVSRGALSAVEIVNRSKEPANDIEPFSLSQAYHHLSKLIDHGYVIKYGTLTTGKRETNYYQRCARTFILNRLPGTKDQSIEERLKLAKEQITNYADRILDLFDFNLSDREYEKLLSLLTKRESIELEAESFAKVVNLTKNDIATNDEMTILHEIINIYMIKSDDWVSKSRELHDLLFKEI